MEIIILLPIAALVASILARLWTPRSTIASAIFFLLTLGTMVMSHQFHLSNHSAPANAPYIFPLFAALSFTLCLTFGVGWPLTIAALFPPLISPLVGGWPDMFVIPTIICSFFATVLGIIPAKLTVLLTRCLTRRWDKKKPITIGSLTDR